MRSILRKSLPLAGLAVGAAAVGQSAGADPGNNLRWNSAIGLVQANDVVDLDDRGNARFDGAVGPLPAACTSEPDVAFPIRVGSDRWIAGGAVLR